jgi:hypothetical protein
MSRRLSWRLVVFAPGVAQFEILRVISFAPLEKTRDFRMTVI